MNAQPDNDTAKSPVSSIPSTKTWKSYYHKDHDKATKLMAELTVLCAKYNVSFVHDLTDAIIRAHNRHDAMLSLTKMTTKKGPKS